MHHVICSSKLVNSPSNIRWNNRKSTFWQSSDSVNKLFPLFTRKKSGNHVSSNQLFIWMPLNLHWRQEEGTLNSLAERQNWETSITRPCGQEAKSVHFELSSCRTQIQYLHESADVCVWPINRNGEITSSVYCHITTRLVGIYIPHNHSLGSDIHHMNIRTVNKTILITRKQNPFHPVW
jgi:hypothetical protein